MPEDKCKLNLNSLTEKVNKKVQELKQTQIPPVIVLAPIFNANNITDGYYQRISIIDSSILKDFYKIYIHLQEDYTADPVMDDFYIYEIDDLHMEIGLNPRISETQLLLDSIFKLCKVIYIHTALRLIKRSTGNGIRLLIHKYKLDVFWDVHGAVPNEFALHKDYWGAQEASESEYWLANYSNTIIVVTFAMKKYLIHKYGFRISRKIVVLPIFNEEICDISI